MKVLPKLPGKQPVQIKLSFIYLGRLINHKVLYNTRHYISRCITVSYRTIVYTMRHINGLNLVINCGVMAKFGHKTLTKTLKLSMHWMHTKLHHCIDLDASIHGTYLGHTLRFMEHTTELCYKAHLSTLYWP